MSVGWGSQGVGSRIFPGPAYCVEVKFLDSKPALLMSSSLTAFQFSLLRGSCGLSKYVNDGDI